MSVERVLMEGEKLGEHEKYQSGCGVGARDFFKSKTFALSG